MRVYLDNCCYNRPFDEQAQLSVRLETEAKLEVQRQMRSGELEYVWSVLTMPGSTQYAWRSFLLENLWSYSIANIKSANFV